MCVLPLCSVWREASNGAIAREIHHGRSMMTTYPFQDNEFKAKRVLVTGGTKGMGEAIVRRLTLGGASVATTARSPLPHGQQPALFIQEDIGSAEGVQTVVDRVLKEW